MRKNHSDFSYELVRDRGIVTINFSGPALAPLALAKLDDCRKDLLTLIGAKYVVIDYFKVTSIDSESYPKFASLHKCVRQMSAVLRVCGLSQEARDELSDQGALSPSELKANHNSAVESILELAKG